MGWTKHPDAVKTLQGARSEALASVRRLSKRGSRELPDEERRTLGLELHSELRRFVSLHRAVGGYDRPSLERPVQVLLQLIPSFTFNPEV